MFKAKAKLVPSLLNFATFAHEYLNEVGDDPERIIVKNWVKIGKTSFLDENFLRRQNLFNS